MGRTRKVGKSAEGFVSSLVPRGIWRNRILAAGVLLLAVCFGSCAFSVKETVSYHTFEYPSPARDPRNPIPHTLMVYRFLMDSSVNSYALEIGQTQGGNQIVSRHLWQENPADMITNLILRDFQRAGLFQQTVDIQSPLRYRYALEGTVRTLKGIETNGKASAFVELEIVVIDFESPIGFNKIVLSQLYKAEVPAKDTSPQAIVEALGRGIGQISQRLQKDIRQELDRRN